VELKNTGLSYDQTLITGQGSISQTDWSGGNNQDPVHGYSSASGIDDSGGDIKLFHNTYGGYSLSGLLKSSTFDTGTTSNFYNIVWLPGSQSSASTSVKFQFATAPSSTPDGGWDSLFAGPSNNPNAYYTNANSSFSNSSFNGNRYARYLVYASSTDSNYTPDISDVGFTYTSGCIPPGQVIFQGLSVNSSPGYTIIVSKSGYQNQTVILPIGNGWQNQTITLPSL
jgi:hypothetical protein